MYSHRRNQKSYILAFIISVIQYATAGLALMEPDEKVNADFYKILKKNNQVQLKHLGNEVVDRKELENFVENNADVEYYMNNIAKQDASRNYYPKGVKKVFVKRLVLPNHNTNDVEYDEKSKTFFRPLVRYHKTIKLNNNDDDRFGSAKIERSNNKADDNVSNKYIAGRYDLKKAVDEIFGKDMPSEYNSNDDKDNRASVKDLFNDRNNVQNSLQKHKSFKIENDGNKNTLKQALTDLLDRNQDTKKKPKRPGVVDMTIELLTKMKKILPHVESQLRNEVFTELYSLYKQFLESDDLYSRKNKGIWETKPIREYIEKKDENLVKIFLILFKNMKRNLSHETIESMKSYLNTIGDIYNKLVVSLQFKHSLRHDKDEIVHTAKLKDPEATYFDFWSYERLFQRDDCPHGSVLIGNSCYWVPNRGKGYHGRG